MKTNTLILFFFSLFLIISCNKKQDKTIVLSADREAPLGWVYLRLYKDQTFEFESRGLERTGDIFFGNYKIQNDTLLFKYKNKQPKVGNIAIIKNGYIQYIKGDYFESLEIKEDYLKK